MKKTFTLIVGMIAANLFAQIPNSDFENWTLDGDGNLNPDYWLSPNDQSIGYTPIEQAAGYSGSTYAMRVYTPNLGGFNLAATTLLSFPNTQRPNAISGVYRGTWVSGDSSYISATLVENGNPIGAGLKYFSQNQAGFTPFLIPISYSNANTPDTMFIAVGSGFGSPTTPGADLIIDQLGFVITGVDEYTNNAVQTIFYDGQNDNMAIHLKSLDETVLDLDILSVSGSVIGERKLFASAGESIVNLPMQLNAGLYIVRIGGNKIYYSQKILVTK